MFFHRSHLHRPSPSSQNVTISIIDGNINPNVDKHTAPTKEMKGPKFGTAAEMATGKKNKVRQN